jgi:hypothetical protein
MDKATIKRMVMSVWWIWIWFIPWAIYSALNYTAERKFEALCNTTQLVKILDQKEYDILIAELIKFRRANPNRSFPSNGDPYSNEDTDWVGVSFGIKQNEIIFKKNGTPILRSYNFALYYPIEKLIGLGGGAGRSNCIYGRHTVQYPMNLLYLFI